MTKNEVSIFLSKTQFPEYFEKKNIFQCFSHLKQTHSSASFRYTDAILVARKECLKDLTDYIGLRFERVTFALLTVNELDI